MDKLELAAPAGNWEHLKGSVKAGADSVYLSYSEYGARAYAKNFDFKDLRKASIFCAENNVKIYLALNTIIKESEIPDLKNFLWQLNSQINISAIIIQDLSVLNILKKAGFKKTPLHASTQMNIHNSYSLEFLKTLGFKRAVLAREMTLKQISKMASREIIDLEIFGHGSQCFSYSGQCYFSSFTGERSGNRGRCPQPCRMKYSLMCSEDLKGKKINSEIKDSYFFSKNDLYTINLLPEIIESRVKALKIEGRMKTPEYVSIAVSVYRKYIDLYYNNPSEYKVDQKDINKLKQVFSRQLCEGYLNHSLPDDIINPKRSGSIGNLFGRIIEIKKTSIKNKTISSIFLKSDLELNKNDIIEIWTKAGNEKHLVNNFKKMKRGNDLKNTYAIDLVENTRASINDRVFKKSDYVLDREAKSFYMYDIPVNKKNEIKSYAKNFDSRITEINNQHKENLNKKFSLSVLIEGFSDFEKSIEAFSKAIRNDPARPSLKIHLDLPKSIVEKNSSLSDAADKFLKINSILKKEGAALFLYTPNIAYDKNISELKIFIQRLSGEGFGNYLVSNTGFLNLIKQEAEENREVKYNITCSHFLNIANSLYASEIINYLDLENIKINEIIFSPEITAQEIREASENIIFKRDVFDLGVYSYGFFPMMSARVSYERSASKKKIFIKSFKDQKNYFFKAGKDYLDNTVIYNSKKTCNLFDIKLLYESHVNSHFLDFTNICLKEQQFIFKSYLDLMNIIENEKNDIKNKNIDNRHFDSREYVSYIKKINNSEYATSFTRGHINRKVL